MLSSTLFSKSLLSCVHSRAPRSSVNVYLFLHAFALLFFLLELLERILGLRTNHGDGRSAHHRSRRRTCGSGTLHIGPHHGTMIGRQHRVIVAKVAPSLSQRTVCHLMILVPVRTYSMGKPREGKVTQCLEPSHNSVSAVQESPSYGRLAVILQSLA